jgi:hypothetical protein
MRLKPSFAAAMACSPLPQPISMKDFPAGSYPSGSSFFSPAMAWSSSAGPIDRE